jgi:hypothetical protein
MMTDYRRDVCQSPDELAGPTHPIISHHQNLRVQRFSHNAPRAAALPETMADRLARIERDAADLRQRIELLERKNHE